MKIEKLNENQIRCTLNKEDLATREIKLSELAYGSDKAKQLFRDMMTQASTEVGFEANDIPLVIEAIPVSNDCIVLIVTKVEDPEELDTRFSKFSPTNISLDDISDSKDPTPKEYHSAADILDFFKKISEEMAPPNTESEENQAEASETVPHVEPVSPPVNMSKVFIFEHLEDVCRYAQAIHTKYNGRNILYKDPQTEYFYLVLTKGKTSPETFNKICNIAIEYGDHVPANDASIAHYNEHFTVMIRNKAIQKLSAL